MVDKNTIKAAQKQLEVLSASSFTEAPSFSWHGIEGYGVLHIRDGKPIQLDCGDNRGAKWEDIPEEHQKKILELLENPPSRGTVTVQSVDQETNTIYVGSGNKALNSRLTD